MKNKPSDVEIWQPQIGEWCWLYGKLIKLTDISSIEYSPKIVDYGFIFFPQRHKSNEQAGKNKLVNLPTIPKLQNYFEKGNNLSGCSIDPKVPEEEIEKYLNAAYMNEFDYFIAPNGNDSNNGRTILTPKATVVNCPTGSKILLLPGEYNASILDNMASQIVIAAQAQPVGLGEEALAFSHLSNGLFNRLSPARSTSTSDENQTAVDNNTQSTEDRYKELRTFIENIYNAQNSGELTPDEQVANEQAQQEIDRLNNSRIGGGI